MSHPRRALCVISIGVIGVGMDEDAVKASVSRDEPLSLKRYIRERTTIDHKPREESAGLVRIEDIDLEHWHRVGAHGLVP